MINNDSGNIDQLNSLLRTEISATETYKQAIHNMHNDSLKVQLEEIQAAHAFRAQRLRKRVQELGGTPIEGSGLWGNIAIIVENVASSIGEKVAVLALEEGEDKGLKDYKAGLEKLDSGSRQLIMQELLPGQEQTHSTMSALKKRMYH